MTEKIINIYQKAINTFGKDNQKIQAIEELAELIQRISQSDRENRTDITYEDVMIEIADVEIMLEQLKLIYGKSYNFGYIKHIQLSKLEGYIKAEKERSECQK